MAQMLTAYSRNLRKVHACPQCGQPTAIRGRLCSACRWQRAKESRARSRELAPKSPGDEALNMPEGMVKRLGERLVDQGVLDESGLQMALEEQAHRKLAGESVRLGQLLVEMDLISSQALDRAAVRQSLELQLALQESNKKLESRVRERTAQLRDALVKLNELSQLKADFVASVSHELRTPLTIVSGYVEMLANESLGSVSSEQAIALQSAGDACQRLRTLIENLLQFSESAQDVVSLELARISLERPVTQAIKRIGKHAEKRCIAVEVDMPQCLPLVNIDKHKISWVIGEFLENAVKFSQLGGRVQVQVSSNDAFVEVAVTDSGIGIASERIEEMFNPFHQLDGSIKRQHGGTGLGLALARRIIEAHGSSIEVCSHVGRGSRFSFALPVVE